MSLLIRRSNLMVPVTDAALLANAWRHEADAITLDLEDGVPDTLKIEARARVKDAIAPAAQGGAEIFVRINKPFPHADLHAAVWPGLRGIMLPQIDTAADIEETEQIVSTLEHERGIVAGTLEFIVLLESAAAVWNVRSILTASARIRQIALDESDLAAALGMAPTPEYDPLWYARERMVIEATAVRVQAVGAGYPLSVFPRLLTADALHSAATEARNRGMKGLLCPHPGWIAPVNTAFTPTAEQVAWNRRVREAFAAGVAAGTAAVPLDGRMIDVPVDEWAKDVIAMAEACAAREAHKRAALQQHAREKGA